MNVETGPEGCISQSPIRLKLEEVCKVSVEEDFLRVHVPVYWTRSSTTGVYKENFNVCPEKNQHQIDNIFWRYVDFESYNSKSSHKSRHGHISPTEFGLYNRYKEIDFVSISENRISGNGDRFNQNDFVIDIREGTENCQNH